MRRPAPLPLRMSLAVLLSIGAALGLSPSACASHDDAAPVQPQLNSRGWYVPVAESSGAGVVIAGDFHSTWEPDGQAEQVASDAGALSHTWTVALPPTSGDVWAVHVETTHIDGAAPVTFELATSPDGPWTKLAVVGGGARDRFDAPFVKGSTAVAYVRATAGVAASGAALGTRGVLHMADDYMHPPALAPDVIGLAPDHDRAYYCAAGTDDTKNFDQAMSGHGAVESLELAYQRSIVNGDVNPHFYLYGTGFPDTAPGDPKLYPTVDGHYVAVTLIGGGVPDHAASGVNPGNLAACLGATDACPFLGRNLRADAEAYFAALQATAPDVPYELIGHSYGGAIVAETLTCTVCHPVGRTDVTLSEALPPGLESAWSLASPDAMFAPTADEDLLARHGFDADDQLVVVGPAHVPVHVVRKAYDPVAHLGSSAGETTAALGFLVCAATGGWGPGVGHDYVYGHAGAGRVYGVNATGVEPHHFLFCKVGQPLFDPARFDAISNRCSYGGVVTSCDDDTTPETPHPPTPTFPVGSDGGADGAPTTDGGPGFDAGSDGGCPAPDCSAIGCYDSSGDACGTICTPALGCKDVYGCCAGLSGAEFDCCYTGVGGSPAFPCSVSHCTSFALCGHPDPACP